MTDKDLMTRIKIIVDNLSYKISDLTLMYEHKQVDSEDFSKEASYIKSDSVESIMDLVSEYEESLEKK
jgi:hypothetical protein|nr:MAG TPA: hypothetical protein [Caudoviricetes sp.]